jgi:uncharacterized protein (TIGR00251 family)
MPIITVKVIARASKCDVLPLGDGLWKVKLTRPALEGKANEQLKNVLAEYFRTSKSKVRILSGERSNIKTIKIVD